MVDRYYDRARVTAGPFDVFPLIYSKIYTRFNAFISGTEAVSCSIVDSRASAARIQLPHMLLLVSLVIVWT